MSKRATSRILASALSLLVLLFFLLSCGSDDESPAGPGDGNHAPADTIPPTVVSFDPDSGATDLHLLRAFTVLFSEPMDESSIDSLSVATLPAISIRANLSATGDSLEVRPDSIWPASSDLVLVLAGLTDTSGNDLDTFRLPFATGPYDSAHIADRFEPNNTTGTATPIELNRVYRDLTIVGDDDDFFVVTLTDTLKLTVKTTTTYTDTAASWMIYFVDENLRQYQTLGTSTRTGETESFRRTFLPGTYYFWIWEYYGGTPLIAYDLIVETSDPCPDDAYEDNDFDDEAAAVDTGTTANLAACYLDADWYSFPVVSGATITFTVTSDQPTSIRRLHLIEPGGGGVTETQRDSTSSTFRLDATADGTAKAMFMIWDEHVDYDMTITTTDEK